jgi:antirestriction protein ArdC
MSTQNRRPLTAAEREERRRRDRERLAEATRELLTSDGWRRWLRTRANLHSYSLHNTLLIAQECHRRGFAPRHVAGFKTWLKLGRCVGKGEKGIPILAPIRLKSRDDDGEEPTDERVFFRTVHVYDVSQTAPLPGVEPAPLDPPRAPVEGDSHAHLLAPLERLASELAYSVAYGRLAVADGLCDHRQRAISVSDELAPNGQVGVLIHELAHALVGQSNGLPRAVEEVVVEAVAYLGCAAAGLDTSCDSVPYIASHGDEQAIETLTSAAELIDALARRIERSLQLEDEQSAEPAAA